MPWDVILTALGSSSLTAVILTVLGLTLIQKLIEQGISSTALRFENTLSKSEEAYKKALELNVQIDIHLREQRIQVYGKIWEKTGLLSRWPRATNVKYSDILKFSEDLRSWYFHEHGGMWLSTSARKVYGDLQETNSRVLAKGSEGVISTEDYDAILAACSALRTELTNDLLSRRVAPSSV